MRRRRTKKATRSLTAAAVSAPRLRAIFQKALLAAAASQAAMFVACTAGDKAVGAGGDSSRSSNAASSATGQHDAGSDTACFGEVDAADDCGTFVHLPCGLPPSVHPAADCYLPINDCYALCPTLSFYCYVRTPACVDGGLVEGAPVDLDCVTCAGGMGRAPAGLHRGEPAQGSSLIGRFFATAARLEAASAIAFQRLETELRVRAAPGALCTGARRAATDEVRHARRASRIAERHGSVPLRARVRAGRARSVGAFALENAVEGCIGETFGALLAAWQAQHAMVPEIAEFFRSIARDELRHAMLAWAVADWLEPRLTRAESTRLRAAARKAIARVQATATRGAVDHEQQHHLGWPPRHARRALLDSLQAALWSRFDIKARKQGSSAGDTCRDRTRAPSRRGRR